jgi:hypothetical protein
VFALAAGCTAFLAFDGGGYDILTRQEFALGVWVAIAVGFAFGLLPRSRPGRWALLALGAGAAYLAWMAVSLAWTGSDERTLAEISRLLGYLGIVVLALTALSDRTFRAAVAGISLAAAVVACFAVASRLLPAVFPDATAVAQVFRADRLDYPLDYWNGVAAWGAMAAAIGLAWSAHARLPATRALALGLVPVAGLAVYLTYSRGGAIAATVAVVTVVAASRHRWTAAIHSAAAALATAAAILVVRGQPEIADATGSGGAAIVFATLLAGAAACAGVTLLTTRYRVDRMRLEPARARRAGVAAAIVALLAAVPLAIGPGSELWDQFRNEENVSLGADPAQRLTTAGGNRNDLWSSALAAFEEHPLDGIGPGTFEFWWSREARDSELARDAHSLYLENLAELGIPGLVLLAAFLSLLAVAAVAARRRLGEASDVGAATAMLAAFAVFLVAAGIDWMWEMTAVAALALGGIAAAAVADSPRVEPAERGGTIAIRGLRGAAVLVALAAAAVQVPGVVSTERIRGSQKAAVEGDLGTSQRLAQQAIDAAPWAASPHAELAFVWLAEQRYADARAEVAEAIGREPGNWRYPLVLARIELEAGRRAEARRVFDRGRALRPLSPSYSPFSPLGLRLYTRGELEDLVAQGGGGP